MPSLPCELQVLLAQDDVEDVVLKPEGLAYFRLGRWEGPHPSPDCEPEALRALARHIAERASLQLGLTQPSADAFLKLANGRLFRAHAVVAPLVPEGPEISLRRLPRPGYFHLEAFAASKDCYDRLRERLLGGASILVAGITGSGKTSFVSALLNELSAQTRVLVLEDSPELPLPNPLSSRMLARTDRFGFRQGASWSLSDLVYESLRMRPDRLVIGECRGAEAEALLHAKQSGHAGLITTLHASSPLEARERFLRLTGSSGLPPADLDPVWDLVVQLKQKADGSREISSIWEGRA